MKIRVKYLLVVLPMLCAFAADTYAAAWSNAPLACLPERAILWKDGTQPELCHCPPQSMCPSQSQGITPADVSFNVSVDYAIGYQKHTRIYFTISGTDIAAYYESQPYNLPYAPFDPTQLFVMADNTNYGCPGGANGGWGTVQDYIAPLVKRYLAAHGITTVTISGARTVGGTYSISLCNRLGDDDMVYNYDVTVTVSPTLANQISQNITLPPAFVAACCPAQTFSCPAGTQVQVGSGNSISCEYTSDTARLGCLLEGTPVLGADGKTKNVEAIKLGDRLKGDHGDVTVAAINKFTQYHDEMYGFNGGPAFVTSEHPILTTHGWKSIHPEFTTVKSKIGKVGKLSVGDEIVTRKGTLKIVSIEKHVIQAPAVAYNLAVKGGDRFIANDVVVKSFSQVQIHY